MVQPELSSASLREFETLTRDHRLALERLARRLAADPHEAEDLLQETLVDAYRAFGRFRPGSSFYSWVARIMTNNQFDRARRKKRHQHASLEQLGEEQGLDVCEVPDENANPERALMAETLEAPFDEALSTLLPQQRATVVLCDLNGSTYEEAARAEACPIGTIRSRLHRAHKALQKFLGSLEEAVVPAPSASSRRALLRAGAAAAAGAALTTMGAEVHADTPVRVLVWSTDRDATTPLVESLRGETPLLVRAAALDERHQGLSEPLLRETDVLIVWDQPGSAALDAQRLELVADRVRDGLLGLVVLRPEASSPFLQKLFGSEAIWSGAVEPARQGLTLKVRAPRHPVARGLAEWRVGESALPGEVFEGPRPDVVIVDRAEAEAGLGWQGAVWTVARGRLFCFQPATASADSLVRVPETRRLIVNAVRWVSGRSQSQPERRRQSAGGP